MSATYQMVHYVPDSFRGDRILLGAIVYPGIGAQFIPVVKWPCEACVGPGSHAFIQRVIERLSRAPHDARNVSPSVRVDTIRDTPKGSSAIWWVWNMVRGNRGPHPEEPPAGWSPATSVPSASSAVNPDREGCWRNGCVIVLLVVVFAWLLAIGCAAPGGVLLPGEGTVIPVDPTHSERSRAAMNVWRCGRCGGWMPVEFPTCETCERSK